jgi:hypothetical protein
MGASISSRGRGFRPPACRRIRPASLPKILEIPAASRPALMRWSASCSVSRRGRYARSDSAPNRGIRRVRRFNPSPELPQIYRDQRRIFHDWPVRVHPAAERLGRPHRADRQHGDPRRTSSVLNHASRRASSHISSIRRWGA